MSAVMELSIAAELDGGCTKPTPALPGPPLPRPTRRQARPRGVEMAAEHPFSEARAIRTEPVMPLEGLQTAQRDDKV